MKRGWFLIAFIVLTLAGCSTAPSMFSAMRPGRDGGYQGGLEKVKASVEKGANINQKFGDYFFDVTPIEAAACRGQAEILAYLLSKGGDPYTNPGSSYASYGTVLNYMGGYHAVANGFCHPTADGIYNTALVLLNHIERTAGPKKLEEYVNTRSSTNPSGYSALHLAAQNNYVALMQAVLDKRLLDPNVRTTDSDHLTPLHVAVQYGQAQAADYLVKRGADLDLENSKGMTPRMMLAQADEKRQASKEFWNNLATGMKVLSTASSQASREYAAQRKQSAASNQRHENPSNQAATSQREGIVGNQKPGQRASELQTKSYASSSQNNTSAGSLTVDDEYARQVRKHREMVEAQQKRAELRDAEQRRIAAGKQAEIDAEYARRAAKAKQAKEEAIALREKRKKICEATGKECGALASKQ